MHDEQRLCLRVFVLLISFRNAVRDGRTDEHCDLHLCSLYTSSAVVLSQHADVFCYFLSITGLPPSDLAPVLLN